MQHSKDIFSILPKYISYKILYFQYFWLKFAEK